VIRITTRLQEDHHGQNQNGFLCRGRQQIKWPSVTLSQIAAFTESARLIVRSYGQELDQAKDTCVATPAVDICAHNMPEQVSFQSLLTYRGAIG
jgi:hypothetical protein